METPEIIKALRRNMVETGSLICLGCGHEHNCSVHGCAIMREAADALEKLNASPENKPLTCEDCRNKGQFEPLVKYGLPSPCTGCKRRSPDRYSANTPEMEDL